MGDCFPNSSRLVIFLIGQWGKIGTGGGFISSSPLHEAYNSQETQFYQTAVFIVGLPRWKCPGFLSLYCAARAIKMKTQIHRLGKCFGGESLRSVLSDFLSACFHLASERSLLFYFYFKDCSFYFIQHFSCFQQRAGLGISFIVLPEMELIIFLVPETFGVSVPHSSWFTVGS